MDINVKEVKIEDLEHFRSVARTESVSLDGHEWDYYTGGFLDGKVYGCNGFRPLKDNNTMIYHSTYLTPETRKIDGLWTVIFCARIYLQKHILGEHPTTKILGTIPYKNKETTIQFLYDLGWCKHSAVFNHKTNYGWEGEAITLKTTYGELCQSIVPHVKRMESKFNLNFEEIFGVTI